MPENPYIFVRVSGATRTFATLGGGIHWNYVLGPTRSASSHNMFIIYVRTPHNRITFDFSVLIAKCELPRTNLINKAARWYGYIILGRTGGMGTLSATEFLLLWPSASRF
jgi:hypothetical protein